MPTFAVPIEGQGLAQVREALDRADIPTIGPSFTRIAGEFEEHAGHRMTAVLDASTATAAEARVKDHLPEGDLQVRGAEPWPPELTP